MKNPANAASRASQPANHGLLADAWFATKSNITE
jgi:hypothetical protein